jgi:hypothetical protein
MEIICSIGIEHIKLNYLFSPTMTSSIFSNLDFSNTWVNWISSYKITSFSIKVNGMVRKPFVLSLWAKQGCHVLPYLFILAMQILGYMLDIIDNGIEGI